MCGRFSRDMSWEQVHAFSQGLDLIVPAHEPEASYNIAPTQACWVLAADEAGAQARQMRWGLLPSWARDSRIAASMINARLETVASKPAFRSAWKTRRCLVPASGYFEWRVENAVKQPYWIHDANGPVLMFAGLWENWKTPTGDWLQSFTIITRAALDPMLQLHDRTPLMLGADVLRDWLHAGVERAAQIADNAAVPALVWHPVSRAVGNPRSNGPELIRPLEFTTPADPNRA
ncbi:MAG: SOS response-associated peptidase [Arenimonas sp.]